MECGVCGGTSFVRFPVLWPQLITDWQLSPREVEYINRQQGEICLQCRANLRSIALANAIRRFLNTDQVLRAALAGPPGADLAVLEINEAGSLTPTLRQCHGHYLGVYPQVDIHQLPFPDASFDLVVHSDTLEHVAQPIHALVECRRVLRPGGALCFTVPLVIGRLSRSRQGLSPSYHGTITTTATDFMVQTEFGADAWTYLMEAGFAEVTLIAVEFPAAVAFLARQNGQWTGPAGRGPAT